MIKRIHLYSIQEVFEARRRARPNYKGIKDRLCEVYLRTYRLQNFMKHGTKCVECGIKGEFFAIEIYGKKQGPCLNLYGFNKYNDEVLLTCDHIKPVSKGGHCCIHNLRVLCEKCNRAKGDDWFLKYKVKFFVSLLLHKLNGTCECKLKHILNNKKRRTR